eukprot:1651600-Pyramimonas_sp.AAC.1
MFAGFAKVIVAASMPSPWAVWTVRTRSGTKGSWYLVTARWRYMRTPFSSSCALNFHGHLCAAICTTPWPKPTSARNSSNFTKTHRGII